MRALVLSLALLALLAGPALAEEAAPTAPQAEASPWFVRLMTPTEAQAALAAELKGKTSQQQRVMRPKLAAEFVEAFAAAGAEAATPEEALALHRLAASARLYDKAVGAAMPVFEDAAAPVALRLQAAQAIAGLLTRDGVGETFGAERVSAMAKDLEAFARSEALAEQRGGQSTILYGLSRYYGAADDTDRSVLLNMDAARANPSTAAQAGRSILRAWLSSTSDLDMYPALQAKAKEHFDELRALAADHAATVPEDADERTKSRTASMVKLLENAEAPLMMLGEKAPAWTLEHAFGDVKSLADVEGKVVFVDFWATWCGWCIRSFPAVRDLVRDYAEEDLAILGVTTTASSVSESNYNLDEDMKHKLDPTAPRVYVRKASARSPADPEKGIYAEEEFPAKERETLERFIANHEMTWPVLMIDKAEPSAKYGLQGWPHAVVLDRQGRVRYFKVGALLRERSEQVAHFREILDKLLAEEGGE